MNVFYTRIRTTVKVYFRTVSAIRSPIAEYATIASILRKLVIISLASLALPSIAKTAGVRPPIRTIAECMSLSSDDYHREQKFALDVSVIATFGSRFTVEDQTGRIGVFWEGPRRGEPLRLTAGDRAIIAGRTSVTLYHKQLLIATNAVITGHGKAREPINVTATKFFHSDLNHLPIRINGTVTDSFTDEIDPQCRFLMLHSEDRYVPIALSTARYPDASVEKFINAEVTVTGVCDPGIGDWRLFQGRGINGVSGIEIRVPAAADPFALKEFDFSHQMEADRIAGIGRCAVVGQVIAVWHGDRFLLASGPDLNTMIQAYLTRGETPPNCGDFVRVIGYPETDLFSIIMRNAIWRIEDGHKEPLETPEEITVKKLLFDDRGRPQFQAPYHGRVVRIRGIVRSIPTTDVTEGKLHIENEGHDVPIDVSAAPDALDGLAIGCEIEVTGVCLMDTDAWRPNAPFPRVRGFVIVVRTPSDVHILSRPPWWTPGRLMVVIGSLLAALIVFVVWNRALNRVIARRSRQLLREELAHRGAELRIDERTRLAVELHDSLSQNLSGLACQITAVKKSLPDDATAAAGKLDIAERMLFSSRTELKRCLWDLRGNTLECRSMTEAVRQTVLPAIGDAALFVRFDVSRARLTDTTAHSILCIVRELAANAVRHGRAARIKIAGIVDGPNLVFSVRDNGTGFDITHHAGIAEGHFGLEGIRERVERLNGDFRLESSPETGTSARIMIPMEQSI